MFTDSVMTKSMYDANPVDAMSRSLPRNRAKSSPTTPLQPTEPEANSNSIKVIFIGDSLLHRMNTKKMNVGNIPGIKLTKPGDTLEGSVCRARDYLSKHCDQVCNIVLLAGTNDLRKRKCSPKSLLEALDDSINELKSFSNLQDIFLVKLPPRCDIASVNHKVNIYNQLLDDHFTNIESVSIIDTVPLENRFLYKDGLHLSDLGLDKQCRIILSILYRKLAPELKRERTKRKSNSTKHRPLENISSDRIVGIQCNFPNKNLLFVLGVYLPSSNAKLEEFQEYFDHLWALYGSLSARRYVLILGDLNGDLGNSLGDKGSYEPNQRGFKLLDLVDFFNLCPINLLGSCSGPLESYISHCGRYRSTIDYILLPNCLLHNIVSAKTFDPHVDNTSDIIFQLKSVLATLIKLLIT